jgi:hypothetical protein
MEETVYEVKKERHLRPNYRVLSMPEFVSPVGKCDERIKVMRSQE